MFRFSFETPEVRFLARLQLRLPLRARPRGDGRLERVRPAAHHEGAEDGAQEHLEGHPAPAGADHRCQWGQHLGLGSVFAVFRCLGVRPCSALLLVECCVHFTLHAFTPRCVRDFQSVWRVKVAATRASRPVSICGRVVCLELCRRQRQSSF